MLWITTSCHEQATESALQQGNASFRDAPNGRGGGERDSVWSPFVCPPPFNSALGRPRPYLGRMYTVLGPTRLKWRFFDRILLTVA